MFYMVFGQLPFDSYIFFCPQINGSRFFTYRGESNAELLLLVLLLVLDTTYIIGMYYPYVIFLAFWKNCDISDFHVQIQSISKRFTFLKRL